MKCSFPLAVAVIMMLAACSKGSDDKPEPTPPPVPAGENVKTGVYTINNMMADTAANSAGSATTIYFSLEQNRIVPASQAQTNNWDVAFTGIYNSSIAPNNGKAANSPGFGGPGKGAVYLVLDNTIEPKFFDAANNKPTSLPVAQSLFGASFSNITSVAVKDEEMVTNDYIGLDHFMGTGNGYAFYDFSGALFPGNPKKSHIVYTFPRTVIVKTAKGNFAKLQITSVYKDSPADPTRDNKTGYISFRYAIQMNGSRDLNIK
ncbi:HmuY family protein [Chitinophaga nivalis]|uniref:HmuY family protein n=1 Tax=Chitinophaga nivalis TaxID=2991709 RepID=A0ABT3IT89_9BACT|nr:HmuY family protein [Chitinophaga nivalis]MCW3463117.1 HmuY family protein [Chitinophaga nivalis]MCW3487193.1 HmuY family protein [Chitinophaga nivalis]